MAPDDEDRLAGELSALRRYARALTRDRAAADDLVQDTLLRACERASSFVRGRSLRAWLFAILHNQFVSDLRRRASEARRDDAFAALLPANPSGEAQEQAVYLRQIAERFARLSPEHRAVLHLIAVEGLSYQDAAAVLGVPIGTVMSRLSRARTALAREPSTIHAPGLRIVGGSDAS